MIFIWQGWLNRSSPVLYQIMYQSIASIIIYIKINDIDIYRNSMNREFLLQSLQFIIIYYFITSSSPHTKEFPYFLFLPWFQWHIPGNFIHCYEYIIILCIKICLWLLCLCIIIYVNGYVLYNVNSLKGLNIVIA